MKRAATPSNPVSSSSSRRHRYTKVLDNRKHPIRALWRRNGNFYARITVEDDRGQKQIKWVPLETAQTASDAQEELRKVLVERDENRLRPTGLAPKFKECAETYILRQETTGKRADTLVTEKTHINRWVAAIGELRVDKIRPHHITAHLHDLRKEHHLAQRTCNLSLTCLRNILKTARLDGHLKVSPADGLEWFKTEKKAHRLYSPDEIDRLCQAALAPRYIEGRLATEGEQGSPLKNGAQFVDYLHFLQYSGGREQESLRVRWRDVDMDNGHVMIGAEGDSKNSDHRAVDLNGELRALLEDMSKHRAPDSEWLFPSPQRGKRDKHAKTFRESLLLAREAAGLPDFGFHDLRRFFASRSVMSGIDFLTVSRWLGHKDGGILLAKSYAHLANEHRKTQAARLNFNPSVLPAASVV